MNDQLLISATDAAKALSLSPRETYNLIETGVLGPKRYIGKGTRNFRLEYAFVKAYADGLPTEPRAAS